MQKNKYLKVLIFFNPVSLRSNVIPCLDVLARIQILTKSFCGSHEVLFQCLGRERDA